MVLTKSVVEERFDTQVALLVSQVLQDFEDGSGLPFQFFVLSTFLLHTLGKSIDLFRFNLQFVWVFYQHLSRQEMRNWLIL